MIDIDEPGSRSARELVFDDGIDDRNRSRQKGITYDVCDNLYLDMNGIIHPCVHPEKGPVPTTEEEMFREIFLYVDRIVEVTNPKKLLYLAIGY